MKIYVCMISLLSLVVSTAVAQKAKITFHIVDEDGQSISNASVGTSTPIRQRELFNVSPTKRNRLSRGVSDTNGIAVMTIESDYGTVAFGADGDRSDAPNTFGKMNINEIIYYGDRGGRIEFTNQVSGRWQPWNPTIELPLRRILNPIPMYVRELRLDVTPFPAFDEPLGYDLKKGDWLSPHGNGQIADFIFRVHCDWSEEQSPYGDQYYNATLELTFSNEGDGIIEFRDSQPETEGSIYRLPRYAPESGYTNRWSAERFTNKDGSTLATISRRKDMNYFFRVRTQKDETGKMVSAHYGKIRGPLDFGFRGKRNGLSMTYYFNPTPNDRNMEFDPSRNLFTDLSPSEQVNEP